MKRSPFRFVADGESRLREEIRTQVWLKYKVELSLAKDFWKKKAIRDKIELEIKETMKRFSSPHSLWVSV